MIAVLWRLSSVHSGGVQRELEDLDVADNYGDADAKAPEESGYDGNVSIPTGRREQRLPDQFRRFYQPRQFVWVGDCIHPADTSVLD